jgi:beta-lactamase regulating signal transducer with metallopeptidase domain/protocatechuate 3,4-dioxygenase beta subunit
MEGTWGNGLAAMAAGFGARATVVLLLAWAGAWLLRRRSAAERHAAWAAGLGGVVLLPIVTAIAPTWTLAAPRPTWLVTTPRPTAPDVPLAPAEAGEDAREPASPQAGIGPGHAERAVRFEAGPDPVEAARTTTRATPLASGPRSSGVAWGWVVEGVWLGGALAVGLPTLAGLAANASRRRRGRLVVGDAMLAELAIRLGIRRRRVELRLGDELAVPLTWGSIRPVVLLPAGALEWPESRRRAVLLHELAHVARWDAATLLAGRMGLALAWFHPLAWVAMGRLRLEAERAADDRAVGAGMRASSYAEELVDLARGLRTPEFAAALGMVRRSTLEARMMSLFDEGCGHGTMGRARALRLAAIGALAVGLAATVRPGLATADGGPEPAASVVRLTEGHERVAGRVVDAQGRAAAGAEVVLRRPPAGVQGLDYREVPLVRAEADGEGSFAFEGLAPGRYAIWANQGTQTSRQGWSEGEVVVLPRNDGRPRGPVELRLAPGRSIRARVVDAATGRPIAGATVHAAIDGLTADPRTDAEGMATFGPLPARSWTLYAWAEGHARQVREIDLEADLEADAVEFRLTAGGRLEGVVTDEAGQPLQGVRTRLIAASDWRWWPESVMTDAAGRFAIDGLPRDVSMNVSTFRPDLGETSRFVRLTSERQRLEVSLVARPFGGSVAGTVTDEQGRPIAGARVVNLGGEYQAERREATTGADGRFRLDDLYTNRNNIDGEGTEPHRTILVVAPGYQPTRRRKTDGGPREQPVEVSFTLEPGRTIRGRVVDEAGQPIEGVEANPDSTLLGPYPIALVYTDEDGRFGFDSMPTEVRFEFRRRGFGSPAYRVLSADSGEATVVMGRLGRITGRVVDARTGQPLKAFFVHLDYGGGGPDESHEMPYGMPMTPVGQPFEAADGRFTLGGMSAGLPVNVTVRADGYEPTTPRWLKVAPMESESEVEYRLKPMDASKPRSFAGRILNGEGQPAAGVQVRLVVARERTTDPESRSVFMPFSWPMIQEGHIAGYPEVAQFATAETGEDGRFAFGDVPAGLDTELVWWGGGVVPGRRAGLERLTATEAGGIEVRTARPSRIVGRVTRAPGVEGPVVVRAGVAGGTVPTAEVVVPAGRDTFELSPLATGAYVVGMSSLDPGDPSSPRRKLAQKDVAVTLVGDTVQIDLGP